MSPRKPFSGLRWLISLPPRLFDWVMNNKIKTLLLVGAVWYIHGQIRKEVRYQRYQREVDRVQQIAEKKEQERQERVAKSQSDKLVFRNLPPPIPPGPSAEELKQQEQRREQELLEERAIRRVKGYSFASKPMLPTKPVVPEQAKEGADR